MWHFSMSIMANVLMITHKISRLIKSKSTSTKVVEDIMTMAMIIMGINIMIISMAKRMEECQVLACRLPFCMHFVIFMLFS